VKMAHLSAHSVTRGASAARDILDAGWRADGIRGTYTSKLYYSREIDLQFYFFLIRTVSHFCTILYVLCSSNKFQYLSCLTGCCTYIS
jgi:hypothetical protein